MDELERELKAALQRSDPSPFFEGKVLAAARRAEAGRRSAWRTRWTAVLATAAMLVAGVVWQHERDVERARGERAKAQLMLALKITSAKLNEIQQKVDHVQ
jgi:hypothetical protein